MTDPTIIKASSYQVWDSRGRPTIEVEIELTGGASGRAIAPSGASTGRAEAKELRDGGTAFGGHGVTQAIKKFETEVSPSLRGLDATEQETIDRLMTRLDGTPALGRLGSNTLVATSLALARAAAAAGSQPLWRYLGGSDDSCLPLPEVQIFGGGMHAGGTLDIQDYMVVPVGAVDFSQALQWASEIYRCAGELLAADSLRRGVADEGGYWPVFRDNREPLEWLMRAIESAGLTPGKEVGISLDVAAATLGRQGDYLLSLEKRPLDSESLSEMLLQWIRDFPIVAIEDPLADDDARAQGEFRKATGDRLLVVGDDLTVTNPSRVQEAHRQGACNALLIKPNQAGTLSGAKAALRAARQFDWTAIASARSGESEDVSIVHLAVGWDIPLLKVGSFSRSERMAKWNEGLRIARELGGGGRLPNRSGFPWRL